MRFVNFTDADLFKVFLGGANIESGQFSGASIERAYLGKARLRGISGIDSISAQRITVEIDGEITVMEGEQNIRNWLKKVSE